MKQAMCDECGMAIVSGHGHYKIEGEGRYWCSDECRDIMMDGCYGAGCWRENGHGEDGSEGDAYHANEASGYYSVFDGGVWIPLSLYWTMMEDEEEVTQ